MMPGILLFFNFGGGEIFFILFVALLLFGSKSIPSVARSLGKGIQQFKNASSDIQQDIRDTTKQVQEDFDTETKKHRKDDEEKDAR